MERTDRYCSAVVAVGLIVLVFMGWNEYTRMTLPRSDRGTGTCGMRTNVQRTDKNDEDESGTSARRSFANTVRSTPYDTVDTFFMEESKPAIQHVGQKQDEEALLSNYSWDASAEESEKFKQVNKQKALQAAIRRPTDYSIGMEYSGHRTVGSSNMIRNAIGCTDKKPIPFSKACNIPFGASDLHHFARSKAGVI